jgi:hypothetical protein
MGIYIQNSEGNTNGTVVTAANSGEGVNTPFGYANPGMTYSSTRAAHGTYSISVPASAQYDGANWPITTADRAFAGRFYFYATGASSSDFALVHATVNGTMSFRVLFQGSGRLRLTTKGSVQRWTSTNTYPVDQWVRVEFEGNIGTTNGNGQIRILYYVGDSTTPVDQSAWVTGIDLGGDTGTLENVFTHKYGTGTLAGSLWEDDYELRTGSSYNGLIGPVPSTSAPVANAGSYRIVAPGSQFTLDGSGSTGTITSRSWTALWPQSGAPALTGASTATPSGTANIEGSVYVYQLTVTNSGGSDTDTTNVMVTNGGGGTGGIDLIWNGTAWE